MGRQQSYVKFKNAEVLMFELAKYMNRDSKKDLTYVIGTCLVLKDVQSWENFDKGEIVMVLSGERHAQRSRENLLQELGIDNVVEIVFIDNLIFDGVDLDECFDFTPLELFEEKI